MIKKPINENYCASVVELQNEILLDNCDNVKHTNIQGNLVIVGIDAKVGDVGLFFPSETELSKEYLSANNLYRRKDQNNDKEKAGYFETNGRIKCMRFRGHKSMGLFMPLSSLDFSGHSEKLTVGKEFDHLKDIMICQKYVIKRQYTRGAKSGKVYKKKVSKLIPNQFRFHIDTTKLGKNIKRVKPNTLISITNKIHGTSNITSKILCKRKLSIVEKILKFCGVKINDKQYEKIVSSRKVIKNDEMNPNPNHFYDTDIWSIASKTISESLQNGMTYYSEIVGFLPSGAYIQKDYDYGCDANTFAVYIYRITYTNNSGYVFEFSAKQLQDWCREYNLNPVQELYYGYAKDLFDIPYGVDGVKTTDEDLLAWQNNFLEKLSDKYLEKTCDVCKNDVPNEGVVVRLEQNYIEAYKLKSFAFLERETKELNKGLENIEDVQSEEEPKDETQPSS